MFPYESQTYKNNQHPPLSLNYHSFKSILFSVLAYLNLLLLSRSQFKQQFQQLHTMSLYMNFFSPPTICTIICLHNAAIRTTQSKNKQAEFLGAEGDFKVLDFLVDKIMEQSISKTAIKSLVQYQKNILNSIEDHDLIARLDHTLSTVTDLNSFYKLLYKTIEELKQLKINKNDNSSIIDIFLRRLSAYFQKLSFKQITMLYQYFNEFKMYGMKEQLLNEFNVGSQLQELKFNIENYSVDIDYQTVNRKIQQLKFNDKHNRSEYLRGMNEIIGNKQAKGLDSIHRFFDKEFAALFQDRLEGGMQANTVNHSVLSIAFANLKLGFLDEAIRGINEGLRLSQNNSDQQSINHCIVYLYQINSYVGRIEEEARLTQHAITHSVNLNNVLLMIFSCLNYSYLEKHYDCPNKQNNILSARNIQWTDALHFARKKLYSNFQNTCKGLYHFERNLLIPLFLHKMAILNHIPDLREIFLQGIYTLPHLNALDHAKLYLKQSKIGALIQTARICFSRRQYFYYNSLVKKIEEQLNFSTNPQELVNYWNFKNGILIQKNLISEAMDSIEILISHCKEKGFKKHQYVRCLLQLSRIHKIQGRYYEALNILEEIKIVCQNMGSKQDNIQMNLQKIDILILLGNLAAALIILKKIQDEIMINENSVLSQKFYLIKFNVLERLASVVGDSSEGMQIRKLSQQCFNRGIQCLLQNMNFQKLWVTISQKTSRSLGDVRLVRVQQYLNRILNYFSQLTNDYQHEPSACKSLGSKLVTKIRRLLVQ